jgi:hypothetical protein
MNPIGWYDANSYDPANNQWNSKVGNSSFKTKNLQKANSPFPYIYGTTVSTLFNIPWPGENNDYTFIHLAKYNGDTRGRIWTGTTGNWLSGFWSDSVSFFHSDWIGEKINIINGGKSWLLSVDMNNFARVNKGEWEKSGPSFSPESIVVNEGPYGAEKSDFAIAEFLIFKKKLTKTEYTKVENYLIEKYALNYSTVTTAPSQQSNSQGVFFGPNTNIWHDNDCPNILAINGNLEDCKTKCNNMSECTAFNFNPNDNNCILRGCAVGKEPSWNYPPLQGYSKYPTKQSKSWSVNWMPQTGYINMTIGNIIPFHLNIRDTLTVITSNDGNGWGSQIILSQLHSAPRPLNLIITFNTSTGFTVNYQGQDIAVLPNRLNVTNANDLKIVKDPQDITVNELTQQSQSSKNLSPSYILQNPTGITNGNFKDIPLSTFGLNDSLSTWTIKIKFIAKNNSSMWQGIIGNMYNSVIPSHKDGWGFWLSPDGFIHFRISDYWADDLRSLGNIMNDVEYELTINWINNIYKIDLLKIGDQNTARTEITNKPKLTSDKGSICIGGWWPQNGNEKFQGLINLVEFNTTQILSLNENQSKCNHKDTSYCIFKDYRLEGSTCISPPQTNENYAGLNNYNSDQLREWLDHLYNRNNGDSSTGERANVIDYVKRCKSFPNYSYLSQTIAGRL